MKIIKSRLFKALIFLFILSIILGIISYFMINSSIINDNLYNYFDLIKREDFNYINSLLNSIIYNNKYMFFIWISGIILISFMLIPFIIIYRGISVGLLLMGLIATFKIKGIILFIILLIPTIIINELIYIFMSYYSFKFSIKIYNSIKKDKLINIKSFSKNYLYIYIIFSIILLISSIIEIFISSNLIKLII